MQQAPQSREELLEHLLGDHKLVPDKDLTEADAATLAARHALAHEGRLRASQLTSNPTVKPAVPSWRPREG